MLNSIDATNLLVFLERIQLHAREVDMFVDVRQKLREIARPAHPAPTESDPE